MVINGTDEENKTNIKKKKTYVKLFIVGEFLPALPTVESLLLI